MIERPFWLHRIEEAWREVPVVWLAGVRRSGKTTLAQSLGTDRIHYINLSPLTVPGYPKKVSGLDIYLCNPDGWQKYIEEHGRRNKTRKM